MSNDTWLTYDELTQEQQRHACRTLTSTWTGDYPATDYEYRVEMRPVIVERRLTPDAKPLPPFGGKQ